MVPRRNHSVFRINLSEKIMDLGNLMIAGLAVGQFVTDKEISVPVIFAGLVLAGACYLASYAIIR